MDPCGENPTGLCLGQSQQVSCPSILPPHPKTDGIGTIPEAIGDGRSYNGYANGSTRIICHILISQMDYQFNHEDGDMHISFA
jgi:hypothetical protein